MLTENLQKAIDTLRINDVYLRNSISHCFNGFEPKYAQDLDKLETQSKHAVKQSQVAQLDDSRWLVRVFIELGIRLVDPVDESEDTSVKAIIEGEFVAEYISDEEPVEDCINEYALKNASFHVWPYWREYLMSQCTRMHLPRLVLPTVQFAQNRHNTQVAAQD